MIRYAAALDLVLAHVRPLDAESIPLPAAAGRRCAEEIRSPVALPGFANSAMDGFALATGGREVPEGARRAVTGSLAAGDAPVERDGDEAWEIMTGAPVPEGLDAVVPVEEVDVEEERAGRPSRIRLLAPVSPGQHVRPAGKDFAPGDPVVGRGRRLDPAETMALAALGVGHVTVFRRPRVRILCTGPELVDDPGRPLEPGRIRNSNGPFLSAYLERRGAEVSDVRTLGDEVAPFLREMDRAGEEGTDLVVSTGAVSMGRHDFVPRALERAGARVLFHRVAVRPGKPQLVAVLPGGGLFFGLPGNPISTVVGARFFIEPALRALGGREPEVPWRLPLAADVEKRSGLRYFMRAVPETDGAGRLAVRVLPGQQSFRIAPLLEAGLWAVLPEGAERVAGGTPVEVHGLYEAFPRNSAPGTG